jgi:hypothetical protein
MQKRGSGVSAPADDTGYPNILLRQGLIRLRVKNLADLKKPDIIALAAGISGNVLQ